MKLNDKSADNTEATAKIQYITGGEKEVAITCRTTFKEFVNKVADKFGFSTKEFKLTLIYHEIVDDEKKFKKYLKKAIENPQDKILLLKNKKPQPFFTLQQFLETCDPNAEVIEVGPYKTINLSGIRLNEQANRLAHYLRKRLQVEQTTSQPVIAVAIPPCIKRNVVVYAIWKAGCIYMPLGSNEPIEMLKYKLKETKAELFLTDKKSEQKFSEVLEELGLPVLNIEDVDLSDGNENNPKIELRKNAKAAIYFTSGSTGYPKAILVGHQQLISYVLGTRIAYQLNKNDRFIQSTYFTFDPSIIEIAMAFATGGKLFIINQEIRSDPVRLLQAINSNGITFLQTTPAFLRELTQVMVKQNRMYSEAGFTIACGGEPLDINTVKMLDVLNIKIYNQYGTTETTGYSTYQLCNDLPKYQNICIGAPLRGHKILVLNDKLEKCKSGEEGEIHIGGAGLNSYLNNKELEEKRFVYINDERWYKTGDMALVTSYGIVFRGRKDQQIKLRGKMVNMAGIKNSVDKCEKIVKQSCVFLDDETKHVVIAVILHNDCNDKSGRNKLYDYIFRRHIDISPGLFILNKYYTDMPLNLGGLIHIIAVMKSYAQDTKKHIKGIKGDNTEDIVKYIIFHMLLFLNHEQKNNIEDIRWDKTLYYLGISSIVIKLFAQKIKDVFKYDTDGETDIPYLLHNNVKNIAQMIDDSKKNDYSRKLQRFFHRQFALTEEEFIGIMNNILCNNKKIHGAGVLNLDYSLAKQKESVNLTTDKPYIFLVVQPWNNNSHQFWAIITNKSDIASNLFILDPLFEFSFFEQEAQRLKQILQELGFKNTLQIRKDLVHLALLGRSNHGAFCRYHILYDMSQLASILTKSTNFPKYADLPNAHTPLETIEMLHTIARYLDTHSPKRRYLLSFTEENFCALQGYGALWQKKYCVLDINISALQGYTLRNKQLFINEFLPQCGAEKASSFIEWFRKKFNIVTREEQQFFKQCEEKCRYLLQNESLEKSVTLPKVEEHKRSIYIISK